MGTFKKLQCAAPLDQSVQNAINLSKEFATAHELYYNYFSAKSLSHDIKAEMNTALIKNIQSILKKDDSLSRLVLQW